MSDFNAIRAQPNRTGDLGPLEPSPRGNDGFTLIELMIVIVVLSMTAGVAIYAVGGIGGESVKKACQGQWKALKLSAEAVNTQTGEYPSTGTVWSVATSTPVPVPNNALVKGNSYGAGSTDNGALMGSYPAETDFALQYIKPNPTPGAASNSFAVKVLRASNGSATGPVSGTYTYTDTDCARL